MADFSATLIDGLNSPYGMALVGSTLYVADTDAILKFPYRLGQTHIDGPGVVVTRLPAGTINHHWTKNIIASPDGARLYVTVGSNSNAAENGMDAEEGRASIYEVDLATGQKRVYATGLRNPNGLAWEPSTGALWTVVNERDELGNDLVPDYLTSVTQNAFYGWPFSYFGAHLDDRVKPQRPDLAATATIPGPWDRMLRRSGSCMPARRRCPRRFQTASSSVNTAPGIAVRPSATRWSSCHSSTGARLLHQSTSSLVSGAKVATPTAGRSA